MNYLIVKPLSIKANGRNNLSELRIVPEGTKVSLDQVTTWALRTGPQIIDAQTVLLRKLKGFHMSGSVDSGCVYFMEYADLCKVVTSVLGASDRARYDTMVLARNQARLEVKSEQGQMLVVLAEGALKVIWAIFKGIGHVFFKILLTTLFLRWMHKRR